MKIHEAYISEPDINAVFKDSEKESSGRIFSRNRSTFDDLKQAWIKAGKPDDTNDIVSILKQKGFGNKEITKVFSSVFGQDIDHDDDNASNPAVTKFAEYIKKQGLGEEVKQFLQQAFADELGLNKFDAHKAGYTAGKAVGNLARKIFHEEIQQIFVRIIQEDRTGIHELIEQHEIKTLGRSKKSHNINIEEKVELSTVLSADQYLTLLKKMKAKSTNDLNISRIKSQIIQSWKKGYKSRKHYGSLLSQISLNLHDLIGK